MSSLSALVRLAWRLRRQFGRAAQTPPSSRVVVWGSRGAAAMTVSTCTPFARCRISPATGFHVTSAVGWHATSSFNTWSGTRCTIASSRGSGLRPRVLTATTTTGVFVRQLARFLRGPGWSLVPAQE
jgi:hypothetical protein